jgi:signal transduction histidine kinase
MVAFYLQLFFKNVRKPVLLLSWSVTVIAVWWSLFYLKAWTQIWLFTNCFGFFLLQYECERMQMSAFLKSKEALEEEKSKRIEMAREHAEKEELLLQLNEVKLKEEKSRIDMEIMELEVKNEVKLKKVESAQLLSLLGNVAHDMKTPIHSISMDVDLLKSSYTDAMQRFPEFLKHVTKV